MTQQTFLVEIGTEELPPKTLRPLAISFATNFTAELKKANLEHSLVHWFATPRRIALKVNNLSVIQTDRIVEKRGPAINQAFNATGKPSKAAKRWAYYCGITIDQAERLVTNKGEWLLYRTHVKGKPVQQLLHKIVNTALSKLATPKMMRWGNSNIHFVRPVHTVTMLLGTELIPGKILGVESARTLRGHRFMGEAEIIIDDANQYPQILLDRGKVIADYESRKALIKRGAELMAIKIGGQARLSESLLEEVTSLVEWPIVLAGQFEDKFLALPAAALICTMTSHQKYFPIYGYTGNLLPKFIFVTNIESEDPQQIIAGNEKVVRSRLADAEFFFNTDRKKSLADYIPRLGTLLFQHQLGTMHDKTKRIQALVGWIASQISANVNHATRAALLSKCDLVTNMVFEFSDTQGEIGMHYARYDGEAEDVAIALHEQYRPRFSGDKIPQSLVSCSLAIADKIDTLVGIFGIEQHPNGNKDPFALRRSALGILRIIIEKNLLLDLVILTTEATHLYGDKLTNKKVINDVVKFMLGRFRKWYMGEGHKIDTIQSVLARQPTKPADFHARIKAVSHFRTLQEGSVLIAANKRISNILSKSTDTLNSHIQDALLQERAEIQLANHLIILQAKLAPYFDNSNYQDALIILTTLCEPLDFFFKKIMVMTTDNATRINRLTLLSKLYELFLQIADFSMLQ
ncbi:glycyl-tRNA synthetase, b subunit [Serratia symbiotica str. 'Cinara cedri']|nr:glycyl-tRNA synthetase, b subunit [Serratia symbiotica str. 'Cinara cedri']